MKVQLTATSYVPDTAVSLFLVREWEAGLSGESRMWLAGCDYAGAVLLQSSGCFPSEAPQHECHWLKLTVIALCDKKSFVREFKFFPFFFFFRKERKKLGDKWRRGDKGKGKEVDTHRSRERLRGRKRERGRENEWLFRRRCYSCLKAILYTQQRRINTFIW